MINKPSHIVGWTAFGVAICFVGASIAQVGSAERAGQQNDEAYPEKKQVDPIAANGEIFVNWPKPDVALVFSGEQDGYLEPCGCAGLENQKGGLRRRFTLLKELRDKGWPVVAMDNGGQEKRTGVQAEIKTDFAYRALAKLGYAAVGIGEYDLHMDLLPIVINLDESSNPLVSANVGIVGFDSGYTQRYKIVEAGGMKIGITSVLGKARDRRVEEHCRRGIAGAVSGDTAGAAQAARGELRPTRAPGSRETR